MALKPLHYVAIGAGVIGAIALYTIVAKADTATVFGKPWTSSIEGRLTGYLSTFTPKDVTDAVESPRGVFQGTKGYAFTSPSSGLAQSGTLPMKDLLATLADNGLVLHVEAKYKDLAVPLGATMTVWITKLGDAAPHAGLIVLR